MKADQEKTPIKQYVPKPEPSITDQIMERKVKSAAERSKAYRERRKEKP